jgi:lipopolysaccharide transport system ATP-binding protein
LSDIVIRTEHVSKYYRLGVINHGMLYKDIQTWMARKLGKEDPHSQLGGEHFADRAEGFWALKDLSFDIRQGDRLGIIGKNGAGKSTLLKILSRITAPTEGVVKIRGKVSSLLEVGTGFHGELTGRENIYLNGAILGMKRRETTRKLEEIIDFSEIGQYIDTPVKRYSSGMYVRLAFAVAAHLDSDILIADEVLAVGDASFQKKALGKMSDLSTAQGRTVLFVSHSMNAIASLCTSGIVLDHGLIRYADSDIQKVISRYLKGDVNSNGRNLATWTNEDEFENRHFIPRKVYLINEAGITVSEAPRTEKNLRLILEAEIPEQNSLLNFGIIFSTEEGSILFWSLFKDEDFKEKTYSIGLNRFSVRIPCEYLRPGEYRISLVSDLRYVAWVLAPDTNAASIVFTITASTDASSAYDFTRPGSIAPLLEWRKE